MKKTKLYYTAIMAIFVILTAQIALAEDVTFQSGSLNLPNGLVTSGNVGIGTTSPLSGLTWVSPGLEISGTRGTLGLTTTSSTGLSTIRFKGPSINSEWHQNFGDGADNSLSFFSYQKTGGAGEVLTLKGTGNVGIGTTGPNEKLQVATGLIRFNDKGVKNVLSVPNSCGGNWLTGAHSGIYAMDYSAGCGDEWYIAETDRDGGEASTLIIGQQNDANDHIALMPSGNVGIGTIAPSEKLQVSGNIQHGGVSYRIKKSYTSSDFTSGAGWYRIANVYSTANGRILLTANNNVPGYGTQRAVFNYYHGAWTALGSITVLEQNSYNDGAVNSIRIGYGSSDYGYGYIDINVDNTVTAVNLYDLESYLGAGNIAFEASPVYNPTGSVTSASVTLTNSGLQTTGNLEVGTTTTSKVAVFGGGSGKIDAGTVDPIYTINGRQYATYLPAMTGVKEETAGIILLSNTGENNKYYYEIDFNDLEEGSDLWLFSKVTRLSENFDKLIVLLTPSFDGNVWYKKDNENKKLIIYGTSNENNNLEISYRLTAPRFDYEKWGNYADSEHEGFNLDKLK